MILRDSRAFEQTSFSARFEMGHGSSPGRPPFKPIRNGKKTRACDCSLGHRIIKVDVFPAIDHQNIRRCSLRPLSTMDTWRIRNLSKKHSPSGKTPPEKKSPIMGFPGEF